MVSASQRADATPFAMCAAQSFGAVVTDDEPELERTEPATERDVPVAIVDDGARLARLVAQVLGQHAERVDERPAVGEVEHVAVEVGEQPLVRVEAPTVDALEAAVHERAQLRNDRGRACHRGVDVQPDVVALTDVRERVDRVDGE